VSGIAGLIGTLPAGRGRALLDLMLDSLDDGRERQVETVSLAQEGLHAGRVWRAPGAARAASLHVAGAREWLLFHGEARPAGDAGDMIDGGPEGRALLLSQYRRHGPAFVGRLNGLFSGLLVDPERRLALLFNDRYAGERLYWHRSDDVTYFASEAKALLAALPSLRAFDDAGVAQFLSHGSVQGKGTLFKGVAQLPAASAWTFHLGDGRHEAARYFDPREWEVQAPLPADDFEDAFAETFRSVLRSQMSGHHRIGVSITGGLDTRMIMACLPQDRLPHIAYTYAGERGETLDCRIGRTVAQVRGVQHRVLRVGQDFLRRYPSLLDRTVFTTDGCAGALQSHELYFSRLARACAPVRLTGNFGSEVLRDMSTLKPLRLDASLFDAGLRPLIDEAGECLARRGPLHPVTAAAFREVPWHLFGSMAAARSELTFRTPYLDDEVVRLAYRGPLAQRRSALPALRLLSSTHPELARLPTDRGVSAQGGCLHRLARRGFAEFTFKLDYLHKEGLPSWLRPAEPALAALEYTGLLGLHKFLPYRGWFRRELAACAAERIDAAAHRMPCWNARRLSSLMAEHVSGRHNRLREIHAVLTLEAVDRMLLRPVQRRP
jgi:asparagine synthase (glutamine-hydrolysing)